MTVPRTPQELIEEAKRLSEQATPGPWIQTGGAWRIEPEPLRAIGQTVGEGTDSDAAFIASARTLVPELAAALEQALAREERLKGWPEIEIPTAGSPIDSYRCENQDCPSEYEVWQFRPDDYDLDESVVNCPACGVEGEMFLRQFRSALARLDTQEETT